MKALFLTILFVLSLNALYSQKSIIIQDLNGLDYRNSTLILTDTIGIKHIELIKDSIYMNLKRKINISRTAIIYEILDTLPLITNYFFNDTFYNKNKIELKNWNSGEIQIRLFIDSNQISITNLYPQSALEMLNELLLLTTNLELKKKLEIWRRRLNY
jgi:hypothetical protein